VTVTRTPAARKTPAKAQAKPSASQATRLPATTTSTADTAAAVQAAAGDSAGDATTEVPAPAQPAPTQTSPAQTTSGSTGAAAGQSSGRPAAAKAAAAKAAAAKSESAAKAGAARAAATKAAAAKAAAARSAATAAARAATAAATAATAARASASEGRQEDDVVAAPAVVTPPPATDTAEPVASNESATAAAGPLDVPVDESESESESESATPASTAPSGAEPARTERRPFWRLNRSTQKTSSAVSPPATAAVPVAPAEPSTSAEPAPSAPTAHPGTAPVATPAPPAAVVTAPAARTTPIVRKPAAPRTGAAAIVSATAPIEIAVSGLNKRFGQNVAVAGVNLEVRAGSFYGIVGPNGAGKTTTLSMITGLLRPDSGTISVHGIDVWADPIAAKRAIGVLPDRLRLFDRLTGAQLLYYSGVLRGLKAETVRARSADLAAAFGLESALNRLVADYSAGMTKKIALACAMIHSPRVLVLDEPFESVDPVSAVNVTEILQRYVASGGTVILSSHGMDLIQRVCDNVAIIVQGSVLASGTIDEVRGNASLEERFVDLAGGRKVAEGLEWLHNFSD
jgi:ABC-type multidrug transport system ATPase subunit